MNSLADHLKVKSLQNQSIEINEIRRNARYWRLMDCSIETLERMRHALIEELERVESALHVENKQFGELLENAQPLLLEESREEIERLTLSWDELNRHVKEIDDAILENQLQARLIKFFGSRKRYFFFEGFVFLAILLVIIIVIIELVVPLTNDSLAKLLIIETGISIFLLAEFFFRLSLSTDKAWHFKRYWIDFVASLPLSILHFGRLFRVARFISLLRLLRLNTTIRTISHLFRGLDTITKTFQLNLLKRSLIIAIILLLFGAFSISALELPFNSDFAQWRESFWWSFTTVVTGGFADLYNPVTIFGRIITVALVLVGFVLTSVFTASLTSVLIEDDSSRIERNQHAIENEMGAIQQKLDLLSGETNQGLIALEMVAQSISNQTNPLNLAKTLVYAVLEHYEAIHASVHLWQSETAVLKTIYQAGDGRIVQTPESSLDESLLGQTVAALMEIENPAELDIEPITAPYYKISAVQMICPMVASNQVIGALQVILPEEHGRFYLYNRAPQTLAHQTAVAFKLLNCESS